MSLQGRLVGAITLLLVSALLLGSVLSYWHAQRKVRIEMDAAMEVAQNTVGRAIQELASSYRPYEYLVETIQSFNGDRHIEASLLTARGKLLARSTVPSLANKMPDWFYRIIAPEPQISRHALTSMLSSFGAIVLTADARSEIDEVWGDLSLMLGVMGGFVIFTYICVYAIIGRAIAPLRFLSASFQRIGNGDYDVEVPETGPAEFVRLGRGCNEMAVRLREMASRNRRLSDQICRVQDEERAELARDLHDEVGPFLFAIDVDASTVRNLAEACGDLPCSGEIIDRALAIRRASSHAHTHVRSILGQLRPSLLRDLGLATAVHELVASWRARHPQIIFRAEIPDKSWGEDIDSAIHAVIREAVNNALRHAQASQITLDVQASGTEVIVRVYDDGVGLKAKPGNSGYGLIGIRERVEARGGRLSVTTGSGLKEPGAKGVMVSAIFPLRSLCDDEPAPVEEPLEATGAAA